MVNHNVVKSSWTRGPECVYITTLGAEIKLNFNKKSMCLYNVHDRKKKQRRDFQRSDVSEYDRGHVRCRNGVCAIVTAGVTDL